MSNCGSFVQIPVLIISIYAIVDIVVFQVNISFDYLEALVSRLVPNLHILCFLLSFQMKTLNTITHEDFVTNPGGSRNCNSLIFQNRL
mgnify:CR=1 FL=1